MFRVKAYAASFLALLMCVGTARADLRLGWQTAVVSVILTYAVETGKFDQQGLKVELKPFAAGPAMLPALAAGEVDLGLMGDFPATTGFINGLPIELIFVQSVLPSDVRLVANPAAGIKELKDLKGKKIAVAIGSTSHSHMLIALKSAGLSDADVTLVNVPPAGMVAAYTAGQVDAIFSWEPATGEIEQQGGKVLATTESLGMMTGLFGVASKPYLAGHADDVQKFLRAWSIALSDYQKDPAKVLAYEAKRLNQSVDYLQALLGRQRAVFPPLDQQLSAAYLGSPGNVSDSRLLAHVSTVGQFLLTINRVNALPPSFVPLINQAPIATLLKSK